MPHNWPATASARPLVAVVGGTSPLLAAELISLTSIESADGRGRCEATFNNWGETGSGIGYLFPDSSTFDLGKQLQARIGTVIIFTGPITAITTAHPDGSPPLLSITAEYLPTVRLQLQPKRRVPKSWAATVGAALRELSISLDFRGITGQATAIANGSLHNGDTVTVSGTVPRLAGRYTVSGVQHLFDLQMGLRTEFTLYSPENGREVHGS